MMRVIISLVFCLLVPWPLSAAQQPVDALTFSTHNFSPFSSVDKNNNPVGPFIDILTLACAELNYQCQFVSVPNRRSKLMLRNHQAQANFPMGWNTERNEWLYFSIPLMNMQYGFFQLTEQNQTISSIKELQKLHVGVFGPSNASYQLEKIQQKMHLMGLKEFGIVQITDANGTGVKMLEHDRIDVYFANTLQADTHLSQLGLKNIKLAFIHSQHPYFVGFDQTQISATQIAKFNKVLFMLYNKHDRFAGILNKYNIEPVTLSPEVLMQFNIIIK